LGGSGVTRGGGRDPLALVNRATGVLYPGAVRRGEGAVDWG